MGALYITLFATVSVVLLSYYLNTDLPDGMSEPWKLKLFIGGFKIANLLAQFVSMFGYDSLTISRKTFGTAFAWTSQPYSTERLEILDTTIADVPVRIYRPNDFKDRKELLPVVVYFHGGGMITFSIDTYENVLRQVSTELQAVVISVGYRLAPEHKFPVPVDDCFAVTVNVLRHTSEYGGDTTRVVLAGDSAGGNLAAAVSWRLAYNTSRESDENVRPKLQVLLYPMLQAFNFQTGSYITQSIDTAQSGPIAAAWYMYCTGKSTPPVLELLANNHTSNLLKKSIYSEFVDRSLIKDDRYTPKTVVSMSNNAKYNVELAAEMESCVTNSYFSPLMADDVSRFPSTYILSVEMDILRDESFMFETRLRSGGVKVVHDHLPGAWHGVVSYTRTNTGQYALKRVINFLKDNI